MICVLYEDTTNNSDGLSALFACEVIHGEALEFIVVGTRRKLKGFPQLEKVLDGAPNHAYTYH